MEKPFYNDLRLGILGGGQLGRMLLQAAFDFNIHIRVLDPAADAPCSAYAHAFTQGDLTDYDTVFAFGQEADLLTIEIENVNAQALIDLKAAGKTVFPDPEIIQMIQDKRAQKQFFHEHGLPTAPFRLVNNREDVRRHASMLPMVHKLAKAGYDGRGVQMLRRPEDLDKAFDAPGLLEELVDFETEVSVIVARNAVGEVQTYPLVEMVFHPEQNLVEYLFSPANLPVVQAVKAHEIAIELVRHLDYVGVLAIEMFALPGGGLMINELAPRPHNSGHHTIRACTTSQYEQHLRAILGLPLGETQLLSPVAMVNLLGEPDHNGPARYEGVEEVMRVAGVYPHIYGKTHTKPYRKMGHVTILDQNTNSLRRKVALVKEKFRVKSQA